MGKDLKKVLFRITKESLYFKRINPGEPYRMFANYKGGKYFHYMGHEEVFFENGDIRKGPRRYSCTECGSPAREHYSFRETGGEFQAIGILGCPNPECENYRSHDSHIL